MLLVRPGRRSTAADRIKREVLRNDAFDRLREQLGDRFDAEMARRVHGRRRRRRPRRPRARRRGPGRAGHGRHRHPLGRHRVVRLAARQRRRGQPPRARAGSPRRSARSARTAHLVAVSTCYVAGNRRGPAPGAAAAGAGRSPSRSTGAREVEAARRTRADAEAASRTPDMLRRFRKEARAELGAAGTPLLATRGEKAREAWVADAAGRGRPGPGRLARLARRLRLHQGARRAGAARDPRRRPRHDRPARRSSSRPCSSPSPGWIRGFRMAEPVIISYARGLLEGVPRHPRGRHRRHPGRPRGRRHHRRRRPWPGAASRRSCRWPRAPRSRCTTASSSTSCRAGSPSTRSTTPRASRSSCRSGRSPGRGRVQAQLERGVKAAGAGREGARRAAPPGHAGQVVGGHRGEEGRRRAGARLRHALRRLRRERGDLRRRPAAVAASSRSTRPTSATSASTPGSIDVGRLRPRRPPAVGGRARPGRAPRPAAAAGREPLEPPPQAGARPRAPPRRVRPREHAHRVQRRRVVLVAGHPPPRPATTGCASCLKTLAEAPALLRADRKDRGDFLRSFYRRYEGAPDRPARGGRRRAAHPADPHQGFPAGFRRVRQHRALGHRTVLITGALDFVVERNLRPLFDEIICARMAPTADGTLDRRAHRPPRPPARRGRMLMQEYADARGPPPRARRSPTPTRPATCRCSRRSASPSP